MKIENRQKVLLILTIAMLALYLGDLLVFEPMKKLWKSREAKVVELKNEVRDGKSLLRREEVIRTEWRQIQTNALPNNASLAEQQMLKAFDNWAGESGVAVNNITPQWQNDEDDYSTLDCRVEAKGNIETLSRFLYEIENDPMTLKLDSIELASSDDKGQELTLGLQISGLALVSKP